MAAALPCPRSLSASAGWVGHCGGWADGRLRADEVVNAMADPAYTRVGLGAYAAPNGAAYFYNMIFE